MLRNSLLIFATLVLCGCNSEIIVVEPGVVIRLAAPVTAKVATYDKAQQAWVVRGNAVLPAGGYYVPAPTSTPTTAPTTPQSSPSITVPKTPNLMVSR